MKRTIAWFCLLIFLFFTRCTQLAEFNEDEEVKFMISLEDYADRCEAVWNAQIVSVLKGWEFEHKVASVEWEDSIDYPYSLDRIEQAGGCAPVDDDWYYEMAGLTAFEKYGTGMTVQELGRQWAENNVGVWGSSGQARLNILRGIEAPMSGHPRYNRLWFTMGAQNRCDLYGMLNPGMPNKAAAMARELQHVNSYAEGTDGGVLVAAMVSMAFVEKDHQEIIRKCATVLDPATPHRQCLDLIITNAEQGMGPQEIADAVMDKWQIEYPATNNAVANFGIGILALWFGEGDFMKSLNLGFSLADFTDADCNSTMATVVLAAMHGMKIIPDYLVAPLNDHMSGTHIGHVELVPPVDTDISFLASRTAAMGEKILAANGAEISEEDITIPVEEEIITQDPELFHPNEFMKWFNTGWTMERAGYGAPGGGHRGIRGGTFIDEGILATYPRDEVRGLKIWRKVKLEKNPQLVLEVGADAGRTWKLEIYAGNERLLSKLIDGGQALEWEGIGPTGFPPPQDDYEACKKIRKYETIPVDLGEHAGQEVTIRLYQSTLVRNKYPGNAYWKSIEIINQEGS
jgi:hypothetical protein